MVNMYIGTGDCVTTTTNVSVMDSTDSSSMIFRLFDFYASVATRLEEAYEVAQIIDYDEVLPPFPEAKKVKLLCNYSSPALFINSHVNRKLLRSNKILHVHRKRNRRNL